MAGHMRQKTAIFDLSAYTSPYFEYISVKTTKRSKRRENRIVYFFHWHKETRIETSPKYNVLNFFSNSLAFCTILLPWYWDFIPKTYVFVTRQPSLLSNNFCLSW